MADSPWARLFPEAFAAPTFTCDITLNTTGPLPALNISGGTSFTFRRRAVPAPEAGQGVFASSLAPVELRVSGGASRGSRRHSGPV